MGSWSRRRVTHILTSIFGLSVTLPSSQGYTDGLQQRQYVDGSSDGSADNANFYQRAYHSSVVLRNVLYIHGGEIATWNGTGNYRNLPNNNTYTIDLNSSWTNQTVELNKIATSAPSLINQALWVDPSNDSFYAYDGGLSYALQIGESWGWPQHSNQLWQFTPAGGLRGSWSQVGAQPSSNFSDLVRTLDGTYTYGGGYGFALGGIENAATKVDFFGAESWDTPGMVMYDMSANEWYNISAEGYSRKGHSKKAAAHFVPGFGPAGLVFIFGGRGDDGNPVASDPLSIFDPMSRQWSVQRTSGDKPRIALSSCVIGVQGDNDTYEIFLYGGWSGANNKEDTIAQGAVHVLSLPSFNWWKQDISPDFGRSLHTCNVLGNTRQMISIGGKTVNSTDTEDDNPPDPWPNGIGVFDMTSMQWKTRYDADAAPYVTPDIVKEYYQTSGRYPARWDNDVVKAWFTETESKSENTTTTDDVPTTTSTPVPIEKSSGSNTGAIAGGTVGGVAALAIIGFLAFFFVRRQRHGVERNDYKYEKPELGNEGAKSGFENTLQPSEMSATNKPAEMPQREIATTELPAENQRHEAMDTSRAQKIAHFLS